MNSSFSKYLFSFTFFCSVQVWAQTPLETTKKVADYIVTNTPFQYRFDMYKPSGLLSDLQVIDFERTFGADKDKVAFAYTEFNSNKDTAIELEISHGGSLEIQLNNQKIYTNTGNNQLSYSLLERSIQLEKKLIIQLKSGVNKVLFKSQCNANNNWKILYQCTNATVEVGLKHNNLLSSNVKEFCNYLVCSATVKNASSQFFNTAYEPEKNTDLSKVYQIENTSCTWTIPKIDLTQQVINPKAYWGSYYNYNYHAAGVAWIMNVLGNISGDKKYNNYANDYCRFVLKAKPFVTYQVRKLWQTNSTDYFIVNTPLLDFTSAPAMPFIYRLTQESDFAEKKEYKTFVNEIKEYIFKHQIRSEKGFFIRQTPEKYTAWTDDMFMGLPFVMYCGLETKNSAEQNLYFTDAANQVINYCDFLMDKKDSLFHHARHTERSEVNYPYWLRANGWGLWAITEVLLHLPESHPKYQTVLKLYQAHVRSLAKNQDATGMWHNIINKHETRLETSGSAIVTLAIARGINNKWLDSKTYTPIALKAWNSIKERIEPDGQVNDIIVGSFTSTDYHYYEKQPFVKNDSHGMLCVLMCGIEMDKLLKQ